MPGSPKRKISPAGTKLTAGDIAHATGGLIPWGDVTARVAENVAARFSVRHAYLINSGRAALTIILKALAVDSPRKEVILPGYTCFTVAASVRRAGLTARLADLMPESLEYDLEDLERQITPQTLAIVAVYPFNLTIDIDAIRRIAQKHGVYLIEDAAQAIGLTVGGRPAGTIGDVGFYSLSKGKPITTMAGGIIITNNDDLGARIRALVDDLPRPGWFKNLKILVTSLAMKVLINPRRYWVVDHLPGLTLGETVYAPSFAMSRMPKSSALLLESLLARLDSINRRRAESAALWQRRLAGIPGLSIVSGHQSKDDLFLRLPVLFESREHREQAMAQTKELGASRMYGEPLEVIADPALYGNGARKCPHARNVADRLLTLPTHEYVTDEDMAEVVRLLGAARTQAIVNHE